MPRRGNRLLSGQSPSAWRGRAVLFAQVVSLRRTLAVRFALASILRPGLCHTISLISWVLQLAYEFQRY
jgi:hypothetical protein